MRPTHNRESSNDLASTPDTRHVPQRLRRLAGVKLGRLVGFARLLDARLLLTIAALAIVASVLTVTAYMQQRQVATPARLPTQDVNRSGPRPVKRQKTSYTQEGGAIKAMLDQAVHEDGTEWTPSAAISVPTVAIPNTPSAIKTWNGAGAAGGTGNTDFNAAANWLPATALVATDDLVVNVLPSTSATITTSASVTVNSLSVTMSGNLGATGVVFNLQIPNQTLTVNGAVTANNTASGGGAHQLQFTVGNGAGTSAAFVMKSAADFGSASTNTVFLRGVNSSTSNVFQFEGNTTMGAQAATSVANFPSKVIFNGSGAQTVTINSTSIGWPSVDIGGANSPIVTLAGSSNAFINNANSPTTTNLTINGSSTLDLASHTLNSNSTAFTCTFSLLSTSTIKLGAATGGITGSNFPLNFSTYTLSTTGTEVYNASAAQTINLIGGKGNLTCSNAAGVTFGGAITTAGTLSVTVGNVNAGAFLLTTNGATTVTAGALLSFPSGGIMKNAGTVTSTASTLVFNTGAKYQHNFTTAGGTIPTATWNTGSTCEILGYTTNSTTPGGLGQSFSNFTFNSPNQTGNYNLTGNLTTVNGNLTVTTTNTGEVRFTGTTPYTLAVGGDLIISGGSLDLANGSGGGPFNINIGGNYNQTGGTLKCTNTTSIPTVNFTGGTASVTFVRSAGTLTGTNINWQIASGKTVTFNNAFTVAAARSMTVTAGGTLATAVAFTNSGTFAVNGTFQINAGGSETGTAPTYATTSLLKYNSGGTFNRSLEWSATANPGYPGSVQISNNTTLDLGNGGAGTARQMAGSLTIDSGSTLSMAVTPMTAALSVLGSVNLSGTLTQSTSAGGNLNVGGNWSNGGTFTANGRTVTFNGAANQTLGGANSTTFSTLAISNIGAVNNNIVSLAKNTTVNTALNVTQGVFDQGTLANSSNLSTNTATVSSGATWQNLGTGDLTLSGGVSNGGTVTFNANGTPCGDTDDILIQSSAVGTQRAWSGAGTFSMTDISVQDQAGTAIITVASGTNAGNNGANWFFVAGCTTGATYTWTPAVGGDWNVAANWTPTRTTPASNDVLVFNSGFTPIVTNVPNLVTGTQTIAVLRVINGTAVTLQARATGGQLTINGATGSDLQIDAGSSLTLGGSDPLTVKVDGVGSAGSVAGQIIMKEGAHQLLATNSATVTFTGLNAVTTATDYSATTNPFGTGAGGNGSANSIIFTSGTTYTHNNGGSPFGAAGNPAVAVFQTGSTARWFSNNGFQARIYPTLIIGDSTTANTISTTDTTALQFDSLTINSTASANSSLTVNTSGGINVKGDISSTGAGNGAVVSDLALISSSGIVIAKTVAGTINFTNSGGSVRTVSFGNATANSGNATVVTGNTLALGRKLIVDLGSVITVDGALTGGATGYVIGKEKRAFTGAAAFVYHLGTINGYSPLDANITAGTGDLTASARQGAQPVLTSATSLQRYWTLTEGGAITADLTFHYNTDALDVMGNEVNYRLIVVESGNATSFPESCPDVACVDESANTIRRTGVTTFSDWTAGEPNAPTAVKLTGFSATENNGEVMLQWQSGYEVNNLGYNIYREEDGKRVQITPSLVAGSALIAGSQTRLTAGLSYTWFDQVSHQQSAISSQQSRVNYWLEDVDVDGTRTMHGPIAVSQCGMMNADCKKMAERSALLGELGREPKQQSATSNRQSAGVQFNSWPASTDSQSRTSSPATKRRNAPADADDLARQRELEARPGIKISVSKEGWYRITQKELSDAGLALDSDASHLQLYVGGRAVPIKLAGDGVHLTDSDYLEFYGQGLESTTDAAQTYYLTLADHAGTRLREPFPQELAPPSGPTSFAQTVERKERMIYFSALLNGDGENFFGQIVSNGETSSALPVSRLEESTTAQLEIALQGVTNQNHMVQVSFNGASIGTMNFANRTHAVQTFDIAGSKLREGNNTVELTSLDGAADVSLVDVMRLTYGHKYLADDNRLALLVGEPETKRFGGFDSPNIRVIDITSAAAIKELTPAARVNAEDDGSFSVDVQVAGATPLKLHKLLIFTDQNVTNVDSLRSNHPSSWWSQTDGADYVIISHGDLAASVEPLAQLRRNQGMVVKVVDVEDLYDEFTFGEHSPRATHDFLERAVATWTRQPHYVLLAGDASYDPKNYFGNGSNDLVPTKLIDTSSMETASDDWLADFNNDGLADLSLGRLPARTAAQADTMVGKIVGYENAAPDPSRGALLVADTSFEAPSSAVVSLLPSGMPVATINRSSADDATIHSQIITGINQGPLVTNYIGHGSNGVWTGASLLSSNDAPSLTNTGRLSVFTMMTCFNGFFQDAQNDSLSEALLKSQGGAVAVWASTALTDPAGQNVIDQEFYRQLFGAQPATLGDAARAAKATTTDADVRRTWTLFGDPAMRLR